MYDFNSSIYVYPNQLEYVDYYLSFRKVKYATRPCTDGTIEISANEKFEKVLDNLSRRCYNEHIKEKEKRK